MWPLRLPRPLVLLLHGPPYAGGQAAGECGISLCECSLAMTASVPPVMAMLASNIACLCEHADLQCAGQMLSLLEFFVFDYNYQGCLCRLNCTISLTVASKLPSNALIQVTANIATQSRI